jgi:hypothetical protein
MREAQALDGTRASHCSYPEGEGRRRSPYRRRRATLQCYRQLVEREADALHLATLPSVPIEQVDLPTPVHQHLARHTAIAD